MNAKITASALKQMQGKRPDDLVLLTLRTNVVLKALRKKSPDPVIAGRQGIFTERHEEVRWDTITQYARFAAGFGSSTD
jgi:hypothetical protein